MLASILLNIITYLFYSVNNINPLHAQACTRVKDRKLIYDQCIIPNQCIVTTDALVTRRARASAGTILLQHVLLVPACSGLMCRVRSYCSEG